MTGYYFRYVSPILAGRISWLFLRLDRINLLRYCQVSAKESEESLKTEIELDLDIAREIGSDYCGEFKESTSSIGSLFVRYFELRVSLII